MRRRNPRPWQARAALALAIEGDAVMDRDEHLACCKQRALQYVDRGEIMEGLTSMFSDVTKHPDMKNHKGVDIGVMMMAGGMLRSAADARRFIEGFN
jgi:hypothetical protein